MKLASYQDGSKDAQLVVVSKDLQTAHFASAIAHTLQEVLDDWNFFSPQLQDLYDSLNQGRARYAFPFNPAMCRAPLPRAYQRLQGQAYRSHRLELGLGQPSGPGSHEAVLQPNVVLGSSTHLMGGLEDVKLPAELKELDFEAEIGVITDEVESGVSELEAIQSVRLLVLSCAWMIPTHVDPSEEGRDPSPTSFDGPPPVPGQLFSSFSPVALTPDELGEAWSGGRVHLTLETRVNDKRVGLNECGQDMDFHFGQLIAAYCAHRPMAAGTVLTSGAVCNAGVQQGHDWVWPQGVSSLSQKRAMEWRTHHQIHTPFLKAQDQVHIELKGKQGQPLMGYIEQSLVADEPRV
jgi:fumarylacetoacetate (FAA) hydrolase